MEQLNVSDIARLAMLNEEKGARFYRIHDREGRFAKS